MTSANLPPFTPTHITKRLRQLDFAPRVVPLEQQSAEVIVPPVCAVPAGPFFMGSAFRPNTDTANESEDDAAPLHEVSVGAFQIAHFPVTVAEYACFVRAGHLEPRTEAPAPIPWDSHPPKPLDWNLQLMRLDHPVVCVSWRDATAYAAWLAQLTDQPWCLPTEAQWEKAACYDPSVRQSRLYPWGDVFDTTYCNTTASRLGGTTPVGTYPRGASPCGAEDMAGNVYEWTNTAYKPYPYSATDGRERADPSEVRVLRGGSWEIGTTGARAAARYPNVPTFFTSDIGFRLALAAAALRESPHANPRQ